MTIINEIFDIVFQVCGYPQWFNIEYDDDQPSPKYTYQLLRDLEAGDLTILD